MTQVPSQIKWVAANFIIRDPALFRHLALSFGHFPRMVPIGNELG
jgi:hypothetical protein